MISKQQQESLVKDAYHAFHKREWFRGASFTENHSETMGPTLLVKVNYKPVLEMKFLNTLVVHYGVNLFVEEVADSPNK